MKKSKGVKKVGLFLACYEVQAPKGLLGAPSLQLKLMVDAVSEAVSGRCKISQTIPSMIPEFAVSGSFTYMTVMPKKTNTLVVLTGHPAPGMGNFSFELRMVLNGTWGSKGIANFSYTNIHTGQRETFNGYLAKSVKC